MRITKFGHSCVRLEHDGKVVVVDPGMFTDPEAVDGADAVVITHEHPDHYLPDHLARTDAPVFTIDAVAAKIREDAPDVGERVTVVAPGESFDPGIPADVRRRAARRDPPRPAALLQLRLPLHPRRHHASSTPATRSPCPSSRSTCSACPVCAPWMRAAEGIDFARAVGAPRNLAIHDRIYSEAGLRIVDGQYGLLLPETSSYLRLADGADLE